MLKNTFVQLLSIYTTDNKLITECWDEIEQRYSHKKRHYHTMPHLEYLLHQLTQIKGEINDWETVLFKLYYHDVIYNVLKQDNEEQSAVFAEKTMKRLAVPDAMIANCKAQILATKKHHYSDDTDTNYFTDADLSILGAEWDSYAAYYQNVRKEYSIYPSLMYNPGRKKVLKHFLQMERIYKTDYFYKKLEMQARQNLQQELELL